MFPKRIKFVFKSDTRTYQFNVWFYYCHML